MDSIEECIYSTVEASMNPLHDKIEQLSSNISECKEKIAKYQIQAPEKILRKPFVQEEKGDTIRQIKFDGILEADKEHSKISNCEEQKVVGIKKFLNEKPTVIGI